MDGKGAEPGASAFMQTITAQTIVILSFFFAVLFLIVYIAVTRRKYASRGNILLLVGPSDAGKTSILSTLVYNQTLPTHTSLQANSSVVNVPATGKTVRVVDIPGHPRVRDQFREHLADAHAVLFVVDASTVSRNGPAVAEHLHHVLHALTSLPPSQTIPSLIILSHKADLLKTATSSTSSSDALAVSRVKTILERELEKRRVSQSGGVGVEGLGTEGERSDMGGLECGGTGGAFKFSEWEGGDVEFLSTSVKVGKIYGADREKESEDGLAALRNYLQENIV